MGDRTAFALAQLRHAYKQLYDGTVYRQREFAEGLIGPAIADLERALSPSPQPATATAGAKEPCADKRCRECWPEQPATASSTQRYLAARLDGKSEDEAAAVAATAGDVERAKNKRRGREVDTLMLRLRACAPMEIGPRYIKVDCDDLLAVLDELDALRASKAGEP